MASTPLQAEDQKDEEFFDKLVDDDDGTGQSQSKPEGMAMILSSLSLGGVEDTGCASEEGCSKDYKSVEFSEDSKDIVSFTPAHSEALSDESSGGAKGTIIKEVKWSDFSVNSPQSGQVGFESDSFIASADDSFVITPTGSDPKSTIKERTRQHLTSFTGSYEQQDSRLPSSVPERNANLTEAQNWENLYPGWKHDPNTGQWYQLDTYIAATKTESDELCTTRETFYEGSESKVQNALVGSVTERSDALFSQQTNNSVLENISEASIVSNRWNQLSQGNIEYPSNMIFDSQYPEWYYDTITQHWHTLESYNHALLDTSGASQGQQSFNVNTSVGSTIVDGHVSYGIDEKSKKYSPQEQSSQESHLSPASGFEQQSMWHNQNTQGHHNASGSAYNPQNIWPLLPSHESHREAFVNGYNQQNMKHQELFTKNGDFTNNSTNQLTGSFHGSMAHLGSQLVKHVGFNSLEHTLEHISGNSNIYTSQDYAPLESLHRYNQPPMEKRIGPFLNYTNQSFQVVNPLHSQFSLISNEERSSAGRPPHTLVTFGFGGMIILMKNFSSSSTTFVSESHGTVGGLISIHSLMDVVMAKTVSPNEFIGGVFDYFHSLCHQSFPGPLVGGNAASKDVNKWMDDRIMGCESLNSQNGELLRLIFSLLKILCQHYGKLRSPYGIDSSPEGSDSPESLVSNLLASAKRNDAPFGGFGSSKHCMKNLPSDGQMRATVIKVQTLLVSGKRKEALQCAREGQLWGPALALASLLGQQFYVDTVKEMTKQQFVSGSPLRTLCLLIAGQPADVFSDDNFSGSSDPISGPHQSGALPNSMLDDWRENLAIITSNQTKEDEIVINHLGDCLWKIRGEVIAAHICYLVSEASFESYSDSTRLCLIGADHWKNPRTYASPDAIQRTEIYEYSRFIGNSQFVLLPFQPYKLVYAYMLAEVGKVSDSLRYCQASAKLLKNSGRSPEVEIWKTLFFSLEERLKTQQQRGYATNLAPTKLVGKLFNSIDRSIHRMIGAPPLPPVSHNNGVGKYNNSSSGEVSSNQFATAITSLMPSSTVKDVNNQAGDSNWKVMHNTSITEPDFGRSPKQSSSKITRPRGQGNASASAISSQFGRFGSALIQKTIGWVSWSRQDRQAKLGESNKFYYDEKLKRWVEEGTEPTGDETTLSLPPINSDYNVNNILKGDNLTTTDAGQEAKLNASSEAGFGFPPMPPSQNQFSARSRLGVRSRYVDTFNKGCGDGPVASSFRSPSTPSVKTLAGTKFFVPWMATEGQTDDVTGSSIHENTTTQEPSTYVAQQLIFSHESAPSSSSLQRFPSMNSIASPASLRGENGAISRARAASWSGTYTGISNAKADATEHSFVAPGLGPTLAHIRSSSSSSLRLHGGGSNGLHKVEL